MSSANYGSNNADPVTVAALAYLALPTLIFALGWFTLPLATLLCLAILHSVATAIKSAAGSNWPPYSKPALLLILVTSLGWSAFVGGSHFVYANPDWVVRDAVLGDLIHSDWPVSYIPRDGGEFILRSAIGYFLPPALFGKMFSVAHLDIALYIWTAAGVLLFLLLLPLPQNGGGRLILNLLLVVFFSGMDFVGQVIATESLPLFPLRLEWWGPLSYPSLTNQLLWAPNHCLPIWLTAALLFRHLRSADMPGIAAAMLSLSLIWTPFAAMGIAPFVAFGLIRKRDDGNRHVIPWRSIVSALIIALPIGLFLTTDIVGINATLGSGTGVRAEAASYTLQNASLHEYILFVSCEFLFLALTLAPHIKRERGTFWLAVLVLLGLPLFKLGPSNDLILRLCAPPLIVLLICCLQTLFAQGQGKAASSLALTWLFLAIGAHTAFNELWRAAAYQRSPAHYEITLRGTQEGQLPHHYVGRLESFPAPGWLKKPSGTPVP